MCQKYCRSRRRDPRSCWTLSGGRFPDTPPDGESVGGMEGDVPTPLFDRSLDSSANRDATFTRFGSDEKFVSSRLSLLISLGLLLV